LVLSWANGESFGTTAQDWRVARAQRDIAWDRLKREARENPEELEVVGAASLSIYNCVGELVWFDVL
jgi:hypothetical protein